MQQRQTATARRGVLAAVAGLLAGCLGDDSGTDGRDDAAADGRDDAAADGRDDAATDGRDGAPGEIEQMGELALSSPAFDDGERIPETYGYTERNVTPPLRIEDVPDDAASLALIVDDPDAVEPAGKIWDHWVVWNVPPERTEVPEDWTPDEAEEGTNDYGEVGYGGPNPPDGEHRYRFQLFALDATLDLPQDADADALRDATEGSVLAQTQLDGTYAP